MLRVSTNGNIPELELELDPDPDPDEDEGVT